eukprot:CAMPEP_0180572154 /NCGR_PEP_ID=MMETSP1037_2-20121125/9101_1 /TAXON_ID=632150 /ORGANISM="Azadinium spinosum, Strain 3D9" /LENGTH=81 /DNA_ID=CAMNT_0022589519 /DNA_START=112 /DNA_END=357 /DNA_ORIENTATION=-
MMDQRFPASQELLFKRSLQSHFVFPGYIGAVASAASAFRNLGRSSHDLSDVVSKVNRNNFQYRDVSIGGHDTAGASLATPH